MLPRMRQRWRSVAFLQMSDLSQLRKHMLTDSTFEQLQQVLVSAWHRGDLETAFAQIEIGLREGSPEMKGQCLFYRGMIRESSGALSEAKQDWLDGIQFARDGTFSRYQLEHNIGQACEKSETTQEALGWYRAALRTCSTGGEFSGHETLSAFLRINGSDISPEDTALVG